LILARIPVPDEVIHTLAKRNDTAESHSFLPVEHAAHNAGSSIDIAQTQYRRMLRESCSR
jgi:hypothetical protein